VDLLDVQPHVGLPLPAAQHQVIHLFRTCTRPLQHSALRDALDHLQETAGQCTVSDLFILSQKNVIETTAFTSSTVEIPFAFFLHSCYAGFHFQEEN